MSGADAAKVFSQYLWEYEKTEILEYDYVYYFSVNERIKQSNSQQLQQIYSQRGSSQTQQ